jgi:hypothetical protein
MLKRFIRDRRGSILVLTVLATLAVIAIQAFAVDLGGGFVARAQDQRIADMAAYAAAVAYSGNGGSTSALTAAASRIATLNGLASNAVSASLVTSPTGDGNSAVKAVVSTTVPIYLSGVLGNGPTIPVAATSYAEMRGGTPGCITALQTSGTGISVTGGTGITATTCAVASNGTVASQNSSVYVTCGAKITTPTLDYASTNVPVQSGCTDILPPTGTSSVTFTHATSVDNLAGNSEVAAATGRISTVAAVTSPAAPTVTGGTAVTFGYSPTTMNGSPLPSGCTGALSGSTWTVSCTAAGTYTFGTISLGGGITLNFNTTVPTASRTFKFSGDINGSSGTAMNFGPGTYTIAGGIISSGSMPITFSSAGTFSIGTTSSCSAGAGYSICLGGSGRLVIPGPSTFTLAGGIYQGASGMPSSAALILGSGATTNSFKIGKSSAGYSLNEANGATIFGDASGSGDLFQMSGGITTSGGTCVEISAAAEHDINGSLNAQGGIYLGSGVYTVNGYAAFGAGSGGNVSNCPTSGASTGLYGAAVSLILSGTATTTCSGASGAAFCLGAGYSSVVLTAPTSSSTLGSGAAGLAVVGPISSALTGAADFTSGATNTQISGVFYFPYGAINMSGGALLHDTVDTYSCLELVGSQITLTGGGALGSTCTGLPGSQTSSGGGVALVQ